LSEAGMSGADNGNKERNREIARNEEMRQTVSAVRVSGWAIVFTIIIGVIVVAVVWAWFNR
jgi:tetrahydromethanopterin S-methyltransferase subunit F